ncbi:SLOG family protein [Streptosporangium sp. OZ121]|uniref:SLOG family protein n=1 Tax=Streptosporangium sp. OZ121 TaxID=3444183 RepID=UPI003F79A9D4
MRVIVTGSRDWPDLMTVCTALDAAYRDAERRGLLPLEVVHGGCPTGADAMAAAWAYLSAQDLDRAVVEHVYAADWETHGRAAGPMRNQRMVNAGADRMIAFNLNNSSGTSGTIKLAEDAGIPCQEHVLSLVDENATEEEADNAANAA